MKKEEFYFTSSCTDTKIHAVEYKPEGEVAAILQISHGMVEFIERYEHFAKFMNENGILVVGNDHLGHGKSVNSKEDYGYFCKENGNGVLIKDLYRLTEITKEKYPNVAYFLLGHSMGSFYARQYLFEYGSSLDGAIIMGTGFQPKILVKLGKLLAKTLAAFKGWRYRSEFVNNMAFGSYNKHFKPARTKMDWLSKDEKNVDDYLADERCTFIFTLNGYYNMFAGIERLYDKTLLNKMPKDLPVFFVSGSEDPVGEFSKGVKRAYRSFKDVGMKNVSIKLYEKGRHEILNDTEKDEVYRDILEFIKKVKELKRI